MSDLLSIKVACDPATRTGEFLESTGYQAPLVFLPCGCSPQGYILGAKSEGVSESPIGGLEKADSQPEVWKAREQQRLTSSLTAKEGSSLQTEWFDSWDLL